MSPGSVPPAIGDWDSLPTELQLEIHEILCQICLGLWESLAPYDAVNEQWRVLAEEKTFRSLALHQDDIDTFERIVHHNRRNQLKRIWLTIELPEYPCSRSHVPETAGEIWDNSAEFTKALTRLLSVLFAWEAEGVGSTKPTPTRKITLEISAHSWSDIIHHRSLWDHLRDVPWIYKKLDPQQEHHRPLRRLYSCYCPDTQRVPGRALSHPHGLYIADGLCDQIKPVAMISKLVVLVHTGRAISVEAAIMPLNRKLPHLEVLYYEPWRRTDLRSRNARGSDYLKLVRDVLWDSLQ